MIGQREGREEEARGRDCGDDSLPCCEPMVIGDIAAFRLVAVKPGAPNQWITDFIRFISFGN